MAISSNTKRYTLGGFLFGLLFPLFSWILDGLFFKNMPLSWSTVVALHLTNPIHFVIDSAPFVLGIAFGAMGFYMDRVKESTILRYENIEYYNKENKKIIGRIRLGNTIFPVIIALILVVGFLVLQEFSNREENDIDLIRIGSNQRTLSQKIVYHSNKIIVTEEQEKIKNTDSLLVSLKNLKKGHERLTKQYTLPASVGNLKDSLSIHYQNIVTGIDQLLNPNFAIKNVDSLSRQTYAVQTVRQLETNQDAFSSLMRSIINVQELEAKNNVTNMKIIQFVVVVIIMMFVILLATFGLKPMIDRVKQAFLDVEEANMKVVRNNETLKASEEELRINAEEMRAINDHLMTSQYELEQKQDLLKRAEKMAKMGSFSWNLKNKTVEHSDNLPSIYRLEKGQKVTPSIFKEISHPDDYKRNQEKLSEAAIRNQREIFTNYRARPKHLLGKEDWRHYRAFSLITYDMEKEPYLLTGTAQDVTEEVEQNQKLEFLFKDLDRNKERLEESQRLARIVSYDRETTSEKTNWSRSFVDVFRVDKKDVPVLLDDFREWIDPNDYERIESKWKQAIEKQTSFEEIYRVNVPKGATFYIKEKGYPAFNEEGKLISKRGTLQDITQSEIARLNIEQKSKLIKEQNDNFVSSVNYAQRIQLALLGSTREIKSIFKDSFIFFAPKDIVSGDFYWYAELGRRKIVLVGDCTGHGVPGAFMSLLGTTILNEIILQRQVTEPSEILNQLQEQIKMALRQDITKNRDGMDIAIVVIDEFKGKLEFAGAKNPLVYMHKKRKRGGQEANMTVIKGDNLSIGGRTNKAINRKYSSHTIDLEEVEAFYLYSDGYQDQFGGKNGRKYMSKHFRTLLYETYSSSMLHQRRALKSNLMKWMGTEHKQLDDICIIGITV